MNCDICKEKVQLNFLAKPFGTYVFKDGKKKLVCRECQSKLTREEIMDAL